jgi:hypothetical protein
MGAIDLLERARRNNEFVTGLIYLDDTRASFDETLDMVDAPLAQLSADTLRPSKKALDQVMSKVFRA